MDILTLAILYSLVVCAGYGIANVAVKDVAVRFGAVKSLVYRNVVTVAALVLALLVLRPAIDFSGGSIVFALSIAVLGYFPFLFLVYGLERGKAGVVIPVTSGRIVVSTIFGFLVLGEVLSGGKIAAVLLAFAGVLLASLNFSDLRRSALFSWTSGVPFAVLAALLWGFVMPLFKYPSDDFGALFYALVLEVIVLACGIIHLALTRQTVIPGPSEWPVIKNNLAAILIAGVGTGLASTFNNLAYQTGEVSIVSAIGGSSIVVSLIAAAIWFNERLTTAQYLGVALVAAGVIVAAFA